LTFGRTFGGVEDEIALIDDEPDLGDEGPAVLGDKSEHSGPGACGQKFDGAGGEFGDGGHAMWRLCVFTVSAWLS